VTVSTRSRTALFPWLRLVARVIILMRLPMNTALVRGSTRMMHREQTVPMEMR